MTATRHNTSCSDKKKIKCLDPLRAKINIHKMKEDGLDCKVSDN